MHLLEAQNHHFEKQLAAFNKLADGYRKEWTWVRKIVFVLEQSGQPMRSPDIIAELSKREEHLRNHWNQAHYFSAFLDMALKAECIKREKEKAKEGIITSCQGKFTFTTKNEFSFQPVEAFAFVVSATGTFPRCFLSHS